MSLNFEEQTGSIVQISVWPSIYKVSHDNEELLLEPEAVWTKPPGPMDDVDMEEKPTIKQEPK